MASLPNTRIETHPDGTTGIAGIVNGNWERIELIFNPAISASDTSYNLFTRALTRTAALPTTAGAALQWNPTAGKPTFRPGWATETTAAPVIDMAGAVTRSVTLSGNATFSTSNRASGWKADVIVRAGSALRTLTFPAWRWVGGAAPADIAANKTALLELWSTGTAEADVVARWTVEP